MQPEGASFVLDGHSIAWDRWSLVIGFNAREAITLHDIRFDGRPLFRRASLVEMVVPYGSPNGAHHRKNVFDIGEYGLGKLANSLTLGCDCLGHIAYLDADLTTMTGEAFTIEKAICIHEEDDGLLWKHWDFRTDRSEVRRGRKLVISCVCTVGNYEYASYWTFKQDGEIAFEMKATGIVNTVGCRPGSPSKYGVEVSPGVEGQIHQHAFCARLEPALDGDTNSVVECDTLVEADELNPHGNGFYVAETTLERDGGRKADYETQRYWRIVNPNKLNGLGRPVGYKLAPSNVIKPFVKPDSPSGRRERLYSKPPLGHGPRPRGALSGRGVHEPLDRGRRPPRHGGEGPRDRGPPHRALARLRPAPQPAAGGLPRAALHQHGLHADAFGLFRSQPGHRPAAGHQCGEPPSRRAACPSCHSA